jgi:cell division protein FtsB
MGKVDEFISPKVKYGQKILEFIEKELDEVNKSITDAKNTLETLEDRQQVLYRERKNLMNDLCDEENRYMAEECRNPDFINRDAVLKLYEGDAD